MHWLIRFTNLRISSDDIITNNQVTVTCFLFLVDVACPRLSRSVMAEEFILVHGVLSPRIMLVGKHV